MISFNDDILSYTPLKKHSRLMKIELELEILNFVFFQHSLIQPSF